MRYALISDIHSNLEALTAVLDHIQTQNADEIICLGDIVGYGPNPNECVNLIRLHCSVAVLGNHDVASLDSSGSEYFNEYAKHALFWTLSTLGETERSFLASLSLSGTVERCLFVHASPDSSAVAWDYIRSTGDAIYNFSCYDRQICFYGHSHVPINFIQLPENEYAVNRSTYFNIEKDNRYLINIGSVGQPRDSNPDAAYGLFDAESNEFWLNRVNYDVVSTQQKMRSFDLPQFLIHRLETGR